MNWKLFTILTGSVAALAAAASLTIACADGPDPYSEPTFFFNSIGGQNGFMPFYYTPYIHFYTEWYSFERNDHALEDLHSANVASWVAYTGNKVPAADVDSLVYTADAGSMMQLYEHIRKGYTLKVPAKMSANALARWFISKKDHEAAHYLWFAKQCEPYAQPPLMDWEPKPYQLAPHNDSAAMQGLVHEGIKLCDAAVNAEMKLRYAYQCMRMAFYSREYAQTLMLFATRVKPSNHILYYRCLAMKAGALVRTKRGPEAAVAYSHVFDSCDALKEEAYLGFEAATKGNISIVFPWCANSHDKALMYIMRGMHEYEGPDNTEANIRGAWQLEPTIKGLDVLMTRALNKQEMDAIPALASVGIRTNEGATTLNTLAQQIAADGRSRSTAYWWLASAYLYIMQGDVANGQNMLDKAGKNKMTNAEQDVHYILGTLCTIKQRGELNRKTEKELLPLMVTLENRGKTENRYKSLFWNMMTTVLAKTYLYQGDTERAVYCYSKAYRMSLNSDADNWYSDYTDDAGALLEKMEPERLQRVQAYVGARRKSDWDEWLTNANLYTTEKLLELEGTQYIRRLQFADAVTTLERIQGPLPGRIVLPDILVSHVKETINTWNQSDSGVLYNKLTLARKMKELQEKLTANPTDGRAAYQYANALYNMSYYGKAHEAIAYYRSATDDRAYYADENRKGLAAWQLTQYDLRIAADYYRIAYENNSDPEVKARCLFMMAKCWQKNCPDIRPADRYFDGSLYYKNVLTNPHFRTLKNEYAKTTFYKEALSACSYLKDFAKKH